MIQNFNTGNSDLILEIMKVFDNDPDVSVDCYADDSVLLIHGQNIHEIRDKMQIALGKCENWARLQGLSFSNDKTEDLCELL